MSQLLYIYGWKNVKTISIFQANAEKKYTNQSEVMDDMMDYVFTCMQELEVNPGNIIYFRFDCENYISNYYFNVVLIN